MERSASNIHFTDFPNICRICLLRGDLKPFKESNVYSVFKNLLGNIQTEMEDKLPENICMSCLDDLENISCFISKYKTSESILRSVINQEVEKNRPIKADNVENSTVDVYVKIEKHEINHSANNFKVKEEVKYTNYNGELKVVKNGLKRGTRSNKLCVSNEKRDELNLCLKKWHKPKIKCVVQENKSRVVNGTPSFLCNICGKNFSRKSSLKIHIKIHTGEKNFECSICGFKFILKCTLRRHLAVHRNDKKFQCNICLKVLSQKVYLLRHIETYHSTVKESVDKKEATCFCTICGKGFLFKKWLKRHKNTHETGRFLCTQCGKQFTFKCNLDRHILITHSGAKPFECTICGNKFTCKTSLNCHLNIHNGLKPYQCASCQKCFRQPSSLRKHLLVHSGERRFKCHICEMAFKTGTHLKTHFKKHSRS